MEDFDFDSDFHPYRGDLTDFGAEADNKHVTKSGFVLEATDDGAVWDTIPADQYKIYKREAMVEQRIADNSGAMVDWDDYVAYQGAGNQAFRVTYKVNDGGTITTYSLKPITFAYADPATESGGGLVYALAEEEDIGNEAVTSKKFYRTIQSDNYVAGSSGWQIQRDTGNAEFNNITARGTIVATAGSIGGWTITATALYKDTGVDATSAGMSPSDYPFYAGAVYSNRANAPYRVLPDGSVFATQYFKIGSNDLVFDNATDQLVWLKGLSFDRLDISTTGTFNLDTQGRSWVRLTGTAAAKTIPYIKKPSNIAGQILIIKNDANPVTAAKTSQLTLKNNQGSPPAGYAALSLYGKNVVLKNFGTVTLIYDSANARWTLAAVVKATKTKNNSELSEEGYDEDVSVTAALPTSTSVRAGTDVLTLSAGTLAVDMDIPASSTWTMELVTPADGTTWLFANGNTAYMRSGASDVYFTVTRGVNDGVTQTYTCTFANGTRPLSFAAGSGVLNYGASGQGFLYETVASGLPYSSVRTHTGSPWSPTERVRLGALTGITDANFGALSGYGLWTDNIYLSGSINATAGLISGTLTVSGTLRNSSGNPRWQLDANGFKQYDSGGTQRSQLLNDGSGWLGSSSVLSWTTAGVVSLNGSAVVGNSLSADKVSFSAPTISGLTFTNNSPSAGYVAWSAFTLTYQGATYSVASGNSNSKYIYWKKSVSTTVLQTSATIPACAPDMFIACVNFSGTAYPSNFAPFIYADYISVANLAAINADMGNITAGTITGATIRTAASGARTEMSGTKIFGYNGSANIWEIDSAGMRVLVDATMSTTKAFTMKSGSNTVGGLYGSDNVGLHTVELRVDSIAAADSVLNISSDAPAGKSSGVSIESMTAGGINYRVGVGTTGIELSGKTFVNETANAKAALGSITIHQGGNDNEALAFKRTSVAHGITNLTETDTYGTISPNQTTSGSLGISGYSASTIGIELDGVYTTGNTARSASAVGGVVVNSFKKSGGGTTSPAANENLFVVRGNKSSRFLVDAEGDIHMDATSNINAWDDYDDVKLLEAFRVKTAGVNFKKQFARDVEQHARVLHDTGVLTLNDDGHHFASVKGLFGLTIDAIRQMAWRLERYERAFAHLGVDVARLDEQAAG